MDSAYMAKGGKSKPDSFPRVNSRQKRWNGELPIPVQGATRLTKKKCLEKDLKSDQMQKSDEVKKNEKN